MPPFLRVATVVAGVAAVTCGDHEACEEVVQLQLERRRSATLRGNQSKLHSRSQLTVLDNLLYWQGYGKDSLASYFIGFLGRDSVQVAGITTTAKLGLNLMGTTPAGNFYQSVQSDAAVLGLLPGCFSGAACSPESYDDLLSTVAREGKIHRAFTLCFDDRGGGKMFLGRPQVPADAMRIPLHPLTDGVHPYSPLASTAGSVDFFLGNQRVASRSAQDWNQLVQSGAAYLDTGTAGLLLPGSLLEEVLRQLRLKIMADETCASIWGPYLSKLVPNHLPELTVTQAAATCGKKHLDDFVVRLGADISLNISKSSFFYETRPCSNELAISWSSAAEEQSFVFGTAFHWGKTLLYDTSNLEAPSLFVLGPADGCSASWAETPTAQSLPGQMLSAALPVANSLELKGHPAQVLGPDGTMTTNLMIGSPPQEMAVQVDTGSQKLIGIHQGCRNLGFCFLVQPESLTSTALLPGPEYDTTKCQKQLQVLTQLSSNSSCKQTNFKLLCECRSQEECLRQILSASAQLALEPPSEPCGARRTANCDEKTEFQPEASKSFTPSLRSVGSADVVDFALRFAAMATKREKQCKLYELCSNVSAPALSASASGSALAAAPAAPAQLPAVGTAPLPVPQPPGQDIAPYDEWASAQEPPAAPPAASAAAELQRVLGAAPPADPPVAQLEPRAEAEDHPAAETQAVAQPASELAPAAPELVAASWEPNALRAATPPWQRDSASATKMPEYVTASPAAPSWEYPSRESQATMLPPAPDAVQNEVVMPGAPQYGAQEVGIGADAISPVAAASGAATAQVPQPSIPSLPSFPNVPSIPSVPSETETPATPTESMSAANFPDNSAVPIQSQASALPTPHLDEVSSVASDQPPSADLLRDEVLDMVPVVPTLSPQDSSLAPASDFDNGPKPQPVIGKVIPLSPEAQ